MSSISMGSQEIGTCSVCQKEGPVNRKYYNYPLYCECHLTNKHSEYVYHCRNCQPKPPNSVRLVLDIKPLDEVNINDQT